MYRIRIYIFKHPILDLECQNLWTTNEFHKVHNNQWYFLLITTGEVQYVCTDNFCFLQYPFMSYTWGSHSRAPPSMTSKWYLDLQYPDVYWRPTVTVTPPPLSTNSIPTGTTHTPSLVKKTLGGSRILHTKPS